MGGSFRACCGRRARPAEGGPIAPHAMADLLGNGGATGLPLLAEAALERGNGIRMGLRLLCPLRGCPIGKEHQGTDHFIAPLNRIDEAQLQLRKRRRRFHRSPFTHAVEEGLM
jgi:hypothetical protein